MKSDSTTFGIWVRRVRRWRRWLRRDARQAALIVLLTLSLAEPLVCLIHCRFMMLHAAHAQASAAHNHQHMAAPSASAPSGAIASIGEHTEHLHPAAQQPGAAAFVNPASFATDCPLLGHVAGSLPLSSISESSPPHEHLAAISSLALLMLMLTVLVGFPKPASAPPQALSTRMLRPPIGSLA